jgi:hypothetical protein
MSRWHPYTNHRIGQKQDFSILEKLLQDATGWSAVWKDHSPAHSTIAMRIEAITDAEFEAFSKWLGVEIVRLRQEQES